MFWLPVVGGAYAASHGTSGASGWINGIWRISSFWLDVVDGASAAIYHWLF